MALFTIITTTYNAAGRMESTLKSLLTQTFTDFEYIIMDGLSTDSTLSEVKEIVQSDQRFHIYSEKDTGIYDAMNKAVQKANGQYGIFLGAGDYLYDQYVLERLSKTILSINNDIVYGYAITVNGEKQGVMRRKIGAGYRIVFYPVCHQAVIAKIKLLKETQFNTDYKIAADQDWLLEMLVSRKKFYYVDMPVSYYMLDGVSSSKEGKKIYEQEREKIHILHCPVFGRMKKIYMIIKNVRNKG